MGTTVRENKGDLKKEKPMTMIPITLSIEKSILQRVNIMKRGKGIPHEQELIRLFVTEGLERAGF